MPVRTAEKLFMVMEAVGSLKMLELTYNPHIVTTHKTNIDKPSYYDSSPGEDTA